MRLNSLLQPPNRAPKANRPGERTRPRVLRSAPSPAGRVAAYTRSWISRSNVLAAIRRGRRIEHARARALPGPLAPAVFVLSCVLLFAGPLLAAEEEVNPAAKPGTVQITFLPPPMEGTISLGIYTKAGKLVRSLKREAVADKDFVVGLNGLITVWDGKDDTGAAAKPGSYAVRGYMVHPLEVSGEAFHCNDWISADDAPHPRDITALAVLPNDRLGLAVTLADGSAALLECGLDGQAKVRKEPLLEPGKSEAAAAGKGDTQWKIEKTADGVEVQQFSAKGDFLRRLSIASGEPVPEKIAASTTSDLIFLLERGEGVLRVRGLALETLKAPLPAADPAEGEPKSSTWRIVFSKSIRACGEFATAAPYLGRAEPPKPEAALAIKLARNPLGKKVEASVETSVVLEPSGSFLHTSDGLSLCRLTDTTGLKWAVLVRADKALTLLQSDGAVVEEYKLGKLSSMMAFDAGEYELK